MIKFDHVSFCYRESNSGIQLINLEIPTGSCIVFCGRSGHGKSTVLRLLMGLMPGFYEGELTGSVTIDNKNPNALSPEERAMLLGVVFQDPRSQFFMSSVLEEIIFAAENIGLERAFVKSRLEEQAQTLQLKELLTKSVQDLSSGEKQRVAIAAATFLKPKLLILDEPTANLDEQTIAALVGILKHLKESGTTIVISDHRLHPYREVANTFAILQSGQLQQTYSTDAFFQLPVETFQKYGLRHTALKNNRLEKQIIAPANSLTFDNVQYIYKQSKRGFENLCATVKSGEVTAIIGANGRGKTTLSKVLSGLYRQQKGTIRLNATALSRRKRNQFTYLVMQDPDYQLYAESVGNELVFGKRVTADLKQRALQALETFGLAHLKERHPASLSGGEKQRVTLAAAAISEAEIIVLDEPTSGLDGENMLLVAKWVRQLANENRFVFIITHDQEFIEIVCDGEISL